MNVRHVTYSAIFALLFSSVPATAGAAAPDADLLLSSDLSFDGPCCQIDQVALSFATPLAPTLPHERLAEAARAAKLDTDRRVAAVCQKL